MKLYQSFLLSILLTACASTPMNKYVQQLQWLETADPQKDAEQALAKNDFRLMAMSQRMTVIPGVPAKESLKYELRCGVNFIQGVSDVITSEEHLRLMKKAHQYALQYNAIVKLRCQP